MMQNREQNQNQSTPLLKQIKDLKIPKMVSANLNGILYTEIDLKT